MKSRIFLFTLALLAGFVLAAGSLSAQTIAYRQTNLSSNVTVPGFANHINLSMQNPWGITFEPGQPFFIANTNNGRVTAHDATGSDTRPGSYVVPIAAGGGPDNPTSITADKDSLFGGGDAVGPFVVANIMATENGRIYFWGIDVSGEIPPSATLKVDHSQSGAVYTSIAILKPSCCAPFLAVANFHTGLVEPYTAFFVMLAPPGSFTDANIPAGFAPFGIQVIGSQVFVTYALQDAAKHDPVFGAGNGIVNIFDLEGNFVRRFATAGNLNAPWGITQVSSNFGPFSNDILIGNVGDGTINAFDPVTGNFIGQVKDGDDKVLVNSGLHGLTFRSDGFGDPNTPYFTAGIDDGQNGLFGAINPGLVSTTRASVTPTTVNTPTPISVAVSAGPGNSGTPTGQVVVQDGGVPIAVLALLNGEIVFPGVCAKGGTHVIQVQYSGDANFLPSSIQTEVEVAPLATTLTLLAPASASPGSTVILTATANSAGGIATGVIEFHDGNTNVGTAPLDDAGIATLRSNTLAAGSHSLTATYAGDGKFAPSTSPAVTITIANVDFSLGATPPSATVVAGQSAQFMLTITPAGGFASNVTFTCAPITGITCSFTPAAVTPANGAANTTLTVTTSATVPRYGLMLPSLLGPGFLIAALALFGLLLRQGSRLQGTRASLLTVTAALAIVGVSFTVGGCGGYGNMMQANRGTASIMITAQSGTISHTTAVSVTVQ